MKASLEAYKAGDEDRAIFLWERAIQHLKTLKKQLGNSGKSGGPSAGAQASEGPGQQIQEIMRLIYNLMLGPRSLPGSPIPDGGSATIELPDLTEDQALILQGAVLGPDGQPVLQWVEQVVVRSYDDEVTLPPQLGD